RFGLQPFPMVLTIPCSPLPSSNQEHSVDLRPIDYFAVPATLFAEPLELRLKLELLLALSLSMQPVRILKEDKLNKDFLFDSML
ncbi:MAG: hypothetical protein ACI9LY_000384, partial [Arenicella sp.]